MKKSKECVCADGFENKDGACVDIDECAENPCGENEVCQWLIVLLQSEGNLIAIRSSRKIIQVEPIKT